jgi:hypothetical protein
VGAGGDGEVERRELSTKRRQGGAVAVGREGDDSKKRRKCGGTAKLRRSVGVSGAVRNARYEPGKDEEDTRKNMAEGRGGRGEGEAANTAFLSSPISAVSFCKEQH